MQNSIGNNIIITEPSKNLRTLGRNALAGNWKVSILAVLVYTLIIIVPYEILNALFGVNMTDIMFNSGYYQGIDAGLYSDVYATMPTVSPLASIYQILVSGPLQLGLSLFFLAMFRRQLVEVSDIFLGFEKFGKALGLLLFQALFIILWSMLFLIPGIIASIRYSQAFFILADDPEKGIRQCMDESKAMMKGNKMKYFCMTLSFIGWILLASIPQGLLTGIGTSLGADGFISSLFSIVGSLFVIPVTAYMYSTQAGFYEILAGHLIKSTEPAPIDPIEPVPVPAAVKPIIEAEKPELKLDPAPEADIQEAEAPVLENAPAVEPKPEDDAPQE